VSAIFIDTFHSSLYVVGLCVESIVGGLRVLVLVSSFYLFTGALLSQEIKIKSGGVLVFTLVVVCVQGCSHRFLTSGTHKKQWRI